MTNLEPPELSPEDTLDTADFIEDIVKLISCRPKDPTFPFFVHEKDAALVKPYLELIKKKYPKTRFGQVPNGYAFGVVEPKDGNDSVAYNLGIEGYAFKSKEVQAEVGDLELEGNNSRQVYDYPWTQLKLPGDNFLVIGEDARSVSFKAHQASNKYGKIFRCHTIDDVGIAVFLISGEDLKYQFVYNKRK